MPAQPIEGGKATLELLPDGILHLEWDRDCTITAEDAEWAMAAVNGLAAGAGHPMLVDMETTRTVTRSARAVFAIPCAASRIALLGSSPVDRMLANFFLGVNSPPCPTRFFTSRHLAVAWLQSEAHEHPASA
ncbi:DUF7793 family protein [Arthrobacter sp. MDT1-65]